MYFYQILQDDTVATLFSYYFFQAATTSDKFLPVCGGSARKKNKIYSCQLGHFRHRRGAFFNPKMYQKTRKKLETLKNWEKTSSLRKILIQIQILKMLVNIYTTVSDKKSF